MPPKVRLMTNLLNVKQLRVAYGGIQAVKNIDFSVNSGELVALVGANGAGKTSTLKTLAGLLTPIGGTIHLNGQDLTPIPAYERLNLGLALVPEGRGIFGRLTVVENLLMGAHRREKANLHDEIQQIFELFPRLEERQKQLAGTLSGGEQQMLAIGRALMGKPQLLLLDEPSMGLAPIIVQRIFEIVRTINQQGTAVLLVEQNARLALSIADRAYVMDGGVITLEGSGQELLNNPEVRHAYLGE